MNKIVILHFSPLELYPPVQNLLNSLKRVTRPNRATVISTSPTGNALKAILVKAENIQLLRLGYSGQSLSFVKRYWAYFFFNTVSLLYLLARRPKSILYYETISSYPAYLYKRYFNSKARIFIHFHEYTSPEEYGSGMRLNQFFFKREKWLYERAEWVSHTNEYRMQQFLNDIHPVNATHPGLLPNFPPKSWSQPAKGTISLPVKAVYVGALSLDTMFLKEFAEWLMAQKGNVILEIYSLNITADAKTYLQALNTEWIKLMPGVDYFNLPEILKNYSVGIILYKGHIPNYIYNAPNKLFEYFVCGLDVWLPDLMKGSLPYTTSGTYPKVLAIDFTKLQQYSLKDLIGHTDCVYKPASLSCEEIYTPFIEKLLADD